MTVTDLTAAVGDRHPPVSDALRRRIAVHEAGHIVAAHIKRSAQPLSIGLSGTEGRAVLFARHKGLRDTVGRRLQAAYTRARSLASANRAAVEAIAAHLVVDGHVDRETLRDLLVFCRDRGRPPSG